MKKTILILMFVLMAGLVSAATIDRVINGNIISYTVSGAPVGKWGGIVKETVPSGYSNPTLTSGLDIKITGNLVEIPFTQTSLPTWNLDGTGTATITGTFESNELGDGTITGDSQLGGGGGCTDGTTQSCTTGLCAGTQTCSGGVWGSCVKNDPTCGICNCGLWSDSTNQCGTRTCTPSGCRTESKTCPTSCTSDSDCDTGEICSNGDCVPEEEKCSSNADCEFWEKCDDEECTINVGLIVGVGVALFILKAMMGN